MEEKKKKLPEQLNPSPKNPSLQVQLTLPGVFVQIASEWHPPLFVEHSSVSISL